jgi:hypothetical protein
MTICPIAIVAGCKKCPAFSVCPLKSTLGDQKKDGSGATASSSTAQSAKPTDKGR